MVWIIKPFGVSSAICSPLIAYIDCMGIFSRTIKLSAFLKNGRANNYWSWSCNILDTISLSGIPLKFTFYMNPWLQPSWRIKANTRSPHLVAAISRSNNETPEKWPNVNWKGSILKKMNHLPTINFQKNMLIFGGKAATNPVGKLDVPRISTRCPASPFPAPPTSIHGSRSQHNSLTILRSRCYVVDLWQFVTNVHGSFLGGKIGTGRCRKTSKRFSLKQLWNLQ